METEKVLHDEAWRGVAKKRGLLFESMVERDIATHGRLGARGRHAVASSLTPPHSSFLARHTVPRSALSAS